MPRKRHHEDGDCRKRSAAAQHQHHSGPVGTEAKAMKNVKYNQKHFGYPKEGFVTRIEYSLLYSMISEPTVYPEQVVLQHIAEEDFNVYLQVSQQHQQNNNNNNSRSLAEEEEEPRISYAQLSAILALSAENFAPKSNQQNDNNDDDYYNNNSNSSSSSRSIPQALCKAVLQCVIQYSQEHDLNRQQEVQELLQPVERHTMKRSNEVALKQILPLYVGYAASIITANPLPMLVGASATIFGTKADEMEHERQNVSNIAKETNRRADVEKTGLLDETDDL